MPTFDTHDCERLVERFRATSNHEVDVTAEHLLREIDTETADAQSQQVPPASDPATLLLVLHRLTLHADPLAGEEARTPTTLTEAVQRTYAALHAAGDIALDVGVLVNLFNAAGLGVQSALVYALAEDDEEVETVRAALSTIDGQIIFTHENAPNATSSRTVHEAWSELFLVHLLDAADTDHVASQRFGRCVSALLALADDDARRERCMAAVGSDVPAINRIATDSIEWADATTERLFQLGLDRPELAPLFGTSEYATIDLPAACSSDMVPRCAQWRGEMYFEGSDPDQAQRELDHAVALIEPTEANQSKQLTDVLARSDRYRGALAMLRGDGDTAAEYFTNALDCYRTIDNREGEADCHNFLGSAASMQADLNHTEGCYERSLAIRRELGGPQKKRAGPLNNLGEIAALRGNLERAEVYHKRSLEIGRGLDENYGIAQTLINLGEITRQRGDLDRAEDYCKQGLDLARDIGHSHVTAHGLLGFGKIALDRGELDRAEESVQRGLEIFHESKYLLGQAGGRRLLGKIARKRGDFDSAEDHLTAALTLSRKGNNRHAEATTLAELGELAHAKDDLARAREHLKTAVEIFREIGAVRDTVDNLKQLVAICETLDDGAAALSHSETAVTLVQEAEFDVLHASLNEQHAQLTDELPNEEGD